MKRFTIMALVAALALGTLVAPGAEAGWFKKSKPKRTEKPEWMKEPQRYEVPMMDFHSGVLQQDGTSGWKLGDLSIQFDKDCLITTDGAEEAYLAAGRGAIIMGPRVGDTILAWSVRVTRPDFEVSRTVSSDTQLKPSDTNPACGEVIRAPR